MNTTLVVVPKEITNNTHDAVSYQQNPITNYDVLDLYFPVDLKTILTRDVVPLGRRQQFFSELHTFLRSAEKLVTTFRSPQGSLPEDCPLVLLMEMVSIRECRHHSSKEICPSERVVIEGILSHSGHRDTDTREIKIDIGPCTFTAHKSYVPYNHNLSISIKDVHLWRFQKWQYEGEEANKAKKVVRACREVVENLLFRKWWPEISRAVICDVDQKHNQRNFVNQTITAALRGFLA